MMYDINRLRGAKIGFAMCGSFCTFEKAFKALSRLGELGCDLTPIMSENARGLDTRFGTAKENIEKLKKITGKDVMSSIVSCEPIGPKKMFDALVVAPCTGNTLAKLAAGIIDSSVCMAVKSHLRGERPVVLAVSTNDGLSGASKNIGTLRNMKNFYFVPLCQDDPENKPYSLSADFSRIPQTIAAALEGVQIQPMIFG